MCIDNELWQGIELCHNARHPLFSDAETTENGIQDIVVGDGARELTELVERAAHINGHQIGGKARGKALFDAGDVGSDAAHQVVMAGVGQQGIVARRTGLRILNEFLSVHPSIL